MINKGRKIKKVHIGFQYPDPEDSFLSDTRRYYIHFPSSPGVGDTLHYRYRLKYTHIAHFPIIRIPNIDHVKSDSIIFEHPGDVTVEIESFFPREPIPYRLENVGSKKTIFSVGSLDKAERLPYFPHNDFHAAFLVTLKKDDQPITPTAVDDFITWYQQQTTLRPSLSESDRDILQGEIPSSGAALEKLKTIHDYVRTNIRYVADFRAPHSIVPHEPSHVLQNKYGDCKDRASLASAIAMESGLSLFMALVPAEPGIDFRGTHASLFDHVICAFNDGHDIMFFDPTAKYYAFGNVPEEIWGKTALILDPEGAGRIEIRNPSDLPRIEMEIEGSVDSLNTTRAVILFHNEFAASVRRLSNKLSE